MHCLSLLKPFFFRLKSPQRYSGRQALSQMCCPMVAKIPFPGVWCSSLASLGDSRGALCAVHTADGWEPTEAGRGGEDSGEGPPTPFPGHLQFPHQL